MALLDKNKIFFALINYILSEQNNVDWILKSSLINLVGMSGGISNKNYKSESMIDNIIDYIYQVKPYHVQFSEFIEKFKTDIEQVNILSAGADSYNPTINVKFDAVSSTADEKLKYEYDRVNPKLFDEFKQKWLNTTMANRLYVTKTQDEDEIKDRLNAYFKGLTINGGVFDAERFGYEEYLYEENLYDSPTIEYEYMLVDYKEPMQTEGTYKKEFVFPNTTKFSMDYDKTYEDSKRRISAVKYNIKTGETIVLPETLWEIYEGELVVDIIEGLRAWEKLKITITYGTDYEFDNYFMCVPFKESDSDIIKRKLVQYTDEYVTLELPDNEIDRYKTVILVEDKNGNKTRITPNDFEVENGKAVFSKKFDEYDTIIMTVMDYKFLYDKIYAWEDVYGRLNNIDIETMMTEDPNNELLRKIVRLNGDKFLRANYEIDRPSELTVSNPQSSLMFYLNDDVNTYAEKMNYKNMSSFKTISNNSFAKITNIEYLEEQIDKSDKDINVVKSITFDNIKLINLKENHGCILINSEIIEYSEVDEATNTISKLKRGIDGTIISELKVGDEATIYNKETWTNRKVCCKTKSFQVRNEGEGNIFDYPAIQSAKEYCYGDRISYEGKKYFCKKKHISIQDWTVALINQKYLTEYWEEISDGSYGFDCPTGITNNYDVDVFKLPVINLYESFEVGEDSIILNADMTYVKSHILLPVEGIREYGYLYIDNDIIPFKSFEEFGNMVKIKDFLLPEKYNSQEDGTIYSDESIVYTAIPELLDKAEYELKTCYDYDVGTFKKRVGALFDYDGTVYDRLDTPLFDIDKGIVKKYLYETVDGEVQYTLEMYGYVDESGIIRDITDNEYCQILLNENEDGGQVLRVFKRLVLFEKTSIGESYLLKAYEKGIPDAIDNFTLTIKATPTGSKVKLSAVGASQKGNKITVKANTKVEWEVSKENYFTKKGSITMVKDEEIEVELEESAKLTIETIPEDATVILSTQSQEYTQVGNSITVPLNTEVTYNVSKAGYYTQTDTVTVSENMTKLIELSENVQVDDFDYLVLRYIWTSGRDLDTETWITNADNIPAINGLHVGWKTSTNQGEGSSVPRKNVPINNSILYWSGDNTGSASPSNPQEENILISVKNLLKEEYITLLPDIININLQATWYNTYGTPPVKMEIIAYKGGEMKYSNYRFYNEGGSQIKFKDEYGVEHDSMFVETSRVSTTLKTYTDIGRIEIDKVKKRATVVLID